jgi:hypothetical protein
MKLYISVCCAAAMCFLMTGKSSFQNLLLAVVFGGKARLGLVWSFSWQGFEIQNKGSGNFGFG